MLEEIRKLAQLVIVLSELYVFVALPHQLAMLLFLLLQSREKISTTRQVRSEQLRDV